MGAVARLGASDSAGEQGLAPNPGHTAGRGGGLRREAREMSYSTTEE